MSGHSKWSTIKHKKAKTDAQKGKVYTKMAKLIAVAAREGGADPENNAKLKDAIAKAKSNNMPNDNIDRAIKKGSGELGNSVFEQITYEGYGIGGIAVIVETLTDNKNRTAGDVRYTFDKNGGNLGTTGCVSFMFEKKGTILVNNDDSVDEDDLMMLALDAGADDFLVSEDGYEITTSPEMFSAICEELQQNNIKTESANIEMIPSNYTLLEDEEQIKKFEKMLDMFDDNDDVQEVYHNAEFPDGYEG